MCLKCIPVVTVEFPCGIIKVSVCPLSPSRYYTLSSSPSSVSGRVVPTLSPYWTAASPGLDCETGTAHDPSAGRDQRNSTKASEMCSIYERKAGTKRSLINISNKPVPATQSDPFRFLFAAPFLHIGAGSHYHVLLLSCMHIRIRKGGTVYQPILL